jgi:arginyl-tRNA synthetase
LIWNELTEGLATALRRLGLYDESRIARLEMAIPRDPANGDWTTNLALLLSRETGRKPRELAMDLATAFPPDPEWLESVEVAGPGFLNFHYSAAFLERLPGRIREAGDSFGTSDRGRGQAILVEFVSANPTGPLNVVSARAAAVGATLVRLLRFTGHRASSEFYVNDTGSQVDLLGESVRASMEGRPIPEEGYRGAYVVELARRRVQGGPASLEEIREWSVREMLASQQRDLSDYGVTFDLWFRESELGALDQPGSAVHETVEELRRRDAVFESDGALWLRTTAFGEDAEDRVLVRKNGVPTYLLPDIAYHRDKRARGFRSAIDRWGPDHQGYVPRMKAALLALGLEPDFLEILIVQQVNLLSGGQQVKMSKRAGEFITLRDLMDEVGADCAKFFFLLRSTSAHLDFDLDLAKRQNDENPAYYVQYAHARIASILRYAAEQSLALPAPGHGDPRRYPAAEERALLRRLAQFPEVVRGAAMAREPHRLPTYLMETAAEFHRFYHACRVVSDDRATSRSRLELAEATRVVIANGLGLMGVGAPQRMERESEVA